MSSPPPASPAVQHCTVQPSAPLDPPPSVPSLSKDDSIDSQHIAEENEDMFKNGFYAHYWMKAELSFDHENGQDSLRNPLKMT